MSEGLSTDPVSGVQTSTGRHQQLGGNRSQDRTWRYFQNTEVRADAEREIISIIIPSMETNTETNNIQTVSYKKIVSICYMFYHW